MSRYNVLLEVMLGNIPRIHPEEAYNQAVNPNLAEGKDSLLPLHKIDLNHKEGGEKKLDLSKQRRFRKLFKGKKSKIIAAVFVFLLLFTISLGFLFFRVYTKGLQVKSSLDSLVKAGQEQDLDRLKHELANTKTSLNDLRKAYAMVSWTKIFPYVGAFVSDGEHAIKVGLYGIETAEIVVAAAEPYADIIGFKSGNQEAVERQQTAQDRIDFIVKTIPDLTTKADKIIENIRLVREEIQKIDEDRYPEEFQGIPIREKIANLKYQVESVSEFIIDTKPLLSVAPYLLGVDEERTYLVLFQNDKELRPTGGFITAYSIAKVRNGRFEPVTSDDIYNLDNSYKPNVAAPEVLRKYIKGPYLISKNYRLRDMNWSPDFYESMKLFTAEVEKAGIKDIDGVIAVDTFLLVNILEVLKEIQVPGYGGYSNNIVEVCNCPQVIYELESFADIEGPIVWSENEPGKIVFAPPNYDNRKKIIGPMMNTILTGILSLPNDKMPALFEALMKSVLEKHVLVYMKDSKAQEALESAKIAGRPLEYDGDYLYINDANLGGRKSNLYVTQEVTQDVELEAGGTLVKKLTLTYKNPMRHDGWLNSVLPNYVRLYVPKGSELISFDGVEEKTDPYEEFGKTVFAGFFNLRPLGVAKLTLKYKLPNKFDKEYRILIQKQPGKDAPLYSIKVGKKQDEFFLRSDKEVRFEVQ